MTTDSGLRDTAPYPSVWVVGSPQLAYHQRISTIKCRPAASRPFLKQPKDFLQLNISVDWVGSQIKGRAAIACSTSPGIAWQPSFPDLHKQQQWPQFRPLDTSSPEQREKSCSNSCRGPNAGNQWCWSSLSLPGKPWQASAVTCYPVFSPYLSRQTLCPTSDKCRFPDFLSYPHNCSVAITTYLSQEIAP